MRKNIIAILALLISLGNAGYIVYNKIVTKNKQLFEHNRDVIIAAGSAVHNFTVINNEDRVGYLCKDCGFRMTAYQDKVVLDPSDISCLTECKHKE
ncbi:MAG: hypothetical protein IKK93_07315 [Campylobacter sp.]|nr:hypothetical protein [Campylobacter sp.]